ncbi:MAG: hypothetical protein Q8K28_00935, partial [Hoeflea sp.]|uniref:hypothetical protein n=1 Tax=Hoeflea sp. TaxID=1940281 RepID=UPI00272F6213
SSVVFANHRESQAAEITQYNFRLGSYPQFMIIFFHVLVSTYFGGHLMHHRTQRQKVRRNSRLRINPLSLPASTGRGHSAVC